ncbi:hypothetical protein JCM10908_001834 [Rhodotorula pacifica]|uniref:uncharacterized protein n=1 Tax=Rhodotorula pacifica TaxID=1495444 RepID=UPI00316DD6B2
MSSQDSKSTEEGAFKIQPHPAKTNDPNDLVENTGGLGSAPTLQDLKKSEANPLGGRGGQPYVPNEDLIKNLEAPKSRDELRARQEALNTPSGEGNAGEL